MERAIVIIGGSFNPPTNAHLMLAEITKKQISANYVLFVPTKISYMMEWKKYQNSDILSDDIRVQALESMENEWLKIERCELDGIVSGTSYDTLNYIKNKYQTQRVYFAIGSDKLDEIPKWYNSEQLLNENKFIVIQRNNDDIQQLIQDSVFLKLHNESFIISDESDDSTQQISSTKVREAMDKGDYNEIKEMVPDSVYQIITNNIDIQKQDE